MHQTDTCVLQTEDTAKHQQGLQSMDAYVKKLAAKRENVWCFSLFVASFFT